MGLPIRGWNGWSRARADARPESVPAPEGELALSARRTASRFGCPDRRARQRSLVRHRRDGLGRRRSAAQHPGEFGRQGVVPGRPGQFELAEPAVGLTPAAWRTARPPPQPERRKPGARRGAGAAIDRRVELDLARGDLREAVVSMSLAAQPGDQLGDAQVAVSDRPGQLARRRPRNSAAGMVSANHPGAVGHWHAWSESLATTERHGFTMRREQEAQSAHRHRGLVDEFRERGPEHSIVVVVDGDHDAGERC